MTIGQRIKTARKKAGLTQKELAIRAGTATGTIQQYEADKRQPRLGHLGRIAKAMDTTVYEMLGDDWSGVDMQGAFDDDNSSEMGSRINAALAKLNDKGQSVAVERVEELTKIPDYQREDAAYRPAGDPQEGQKENPRGGNL